METPSSATGGIHARVSSPPGDSTLITSASRSASSIVQYGPASTREKSATISPASGPDLAGLVTLLLHPSFWSVVEADTDAPLLKPKVLTIGRPAPGSPEAGRSPSRAAWDDWDKEVGVVPAADVQHVPTGVDRVRVALGEGILGVHVQVVALDDQA